MDNSNLAKEFVESIIDNSMSNVQKVYIILMARGFLVDLNDNNIVINDNSTEKDCEDFADKLTAYKIGVLLDKKSISLNSEIDITKLYCLFEESQISMSVVGYGFDYSNERWEKFAQTSIHKNLKNFEISALYLEPFIAKYIKALTSIGICTGYSCDGNHLDKKTSKIEIRFLDKYSMYWHKIITQIYLSNKYFLEHRWDTEKDKLIIFKMFSKDSSLQQYKLIARDANTLYNNRFELVEIKKKVIRQYEAMMGLESKDVYKTMLDAYMIVQKGK